MDLVDLETFVHAVRSESLSKTARELHLSQPAVSVRLQKLERDVGEPLLLRTPRGVTPTPAGSHLYQRVVPLLEQLAEIDREIGAGGALRGRFELGATDLVAVHHLPPVLRELRREHPGLELSVRVESTSALVELLDEGRIEIVVATLPVSGPRYETRPLFSDPLVVVAWPGHPLAARRSVRPRELAEEAWILHKSTSVSRSLVEGFFSAEGVGLRVEMEISSPEAIRELVRSGLGLSVLPESSVRREIDAGILTRVPLRGFQIERASGWVLRRDRPLSRAAESLRTILDRASGV